MSQEVSGQIDAFRKSAGLFYTQKEENLTKFTQEGYEKQTAMRARLQQEVQDPLDKIDRDLAQAKENAAKWAGEVNKDTNE